MSITIGIDPGRDGAVVALKDGAEVLFSERTTQLCPKGYSPVIMAAG